MVPASQACVRELSAASPTAEGKKKSWLKCSWVCGSPAYQVRHSLGIKAANDSEGPKHKRAHSKVLSADMKTRPGRTQRSWRQSSETPFRTSMTLFQERST